MEVQLHSAVGSCGAGWDAPLFSSLRLCRGIKARPAGPRRAQPPPSRGSHWAPRPHHQGSSPRGHVRERLHGQPRCCLATLRPQAFRSGAPEPRELEPRLWGGGCGGWAPRLGAVSSSRHAWAAGGSGIKSRWVSSRPVGPALELLQGLGHLDGRPCASTKGGLERLSLGPWQSPAFPGN